MGGLGLEHGLELPAGYVHTYTPCWPVKQPESPGSVESLAGVVPTGSSDDDKLVLADKLVQPQRRPEEDRSQLQGDQELARSLQIEEEAPRLDSIVTSVIADLQATSRCQHRQSRLVQRLGSILKNIFGPSVLLEVFGSTVCNLAGKNSDLDMTFTPGFSKRLSMGEKKTALRKVAKVLQSNGMRAIPVLGARVPIVKIKDVNDTWLAADLSVENELPVFKSRLLNEYALIDDRLSKLVLLVKAWAKARAINSAAQGTFNSFGLSLLVVHYLQNIEPPVLPRLNETTIELRGKSLRSHAHCGTAASKWSAPALVHGECDGIVVCHHTHHQLCGWGADNTSSVALLAHGFFHYFARQFSWDKNVVSVTSKGLVPKSRVNFYEGQHTNLCIQDPLDESDNCARSVGPAACQRILHEFERAYSMDYDALLHETRLATLPSSRASGQQREALKQEERRRKRDAKMKLKERTMGDLAEGAQACAQDGETSVSEEGMEVVAEAKDRWGAAKAGRDLGQTSGWDESSSVSTLLEQGLQVSARSPLGQDLLSHGDKPQTEAASERAAMQKKQQQRSAWVQKEPAMWSERVKPTQQEHGDVSALEMERRKNRMPRFAEPPEPRQRCPQANVGDVWPSHTVKADPHVQVTKDLPEKKQHQQGSRGRGVGRSGRGGKGGSAHFGGGVGGAAELDDSAEARKRRQRDERFSAPRDS